MPHQHRNRVFLPGVFFLFGFRRFRFHTKIEELLPLVESYGRSYDRLQEINAELPNKLKASILQEAIQGKLVSQVDSEGSVEQIESVEENVPFNVPDTWKWVRLGSVVNVLSSKRVHKEDWRSEGIPFYRAREIVALSKYGEVDNELFVEEDFYKSLSADSLPAANDLRKLFKSTLNNRLRRNLACVIDKSSRGAKLKRAFEELP